MFYNQSLSFSLLLFAILVPGERRGGGGGGGTLLYKTYKYVQPKGPVGFLGLSGVTTGQYTLPILVWNRVWFSRELRKRINMFIVSIPNE